MATDRLPTIDPIVCRWPREQRRGRRRGRSSHVRALELAESGVEALVDDGAVERRDEHGDDPSALHFYFRCFFSFCDGVESTFFFFRRYEEEKIEKSFLRHFFSSNKAKLNHGEEGCQEADACPRGSSTHGARGTAYRLKEGRVE